MAEEVPLALWLQVNGQIPRDSFRVPHYLFFYQFLLEMLFWGILRDPKLCLSAQGPQGVGVRGPKRSVWSCPHVGNTLAKLRNKSAKASRPSPCTWTSCQTPGWYLTWPALTKFGVFYNFCFIKLQGRAVNTFLEWTFSTNALAAVTKNMDADQQVRTQRPLPLLPHPISKEQGL